MQIQLKKDDVAKIYDEVDRRIEINSREGVFRWVSEKIECRRNMIQGVYGTLMMLASNWSEVTSWCNEIETERYATEEAAIVAAFGLRDLSE